MKRFALFLMVAGMLSMVACTSAPKKEEATEPEAPEQQQVEKHDTTAQLQEEAAAPDSLQAVEEETAVEETAE